MMTRNMNRLVSAALAVIVIMAFSGYALNAGSPPPPDGASPPFGAFWEIPEVTGEEIAAIEALQNENRAFTYGVLPTYEFFIKENGEAGGYTALLCRWLTEIFGIAFEPRLYQLDDLLEKLGSHAVDFAGSLSAAGGLAQTYVTDPIATRQCVMIRLKESHDTARIALTRPPRYAFLRGVALERSVAAMSEPGSYESVLVDNHLEAYQAIANGEADAYIAQNVAEEFFSTYDDVTMEDFYPLVFTPVHIITANPDLEPIISVITKALRNGAEPHLKSLYNQGYYEYKKSKVWKLLTEEERAYLQDPSPVPMVAQYFSYPISFYNSYEKHWEGIVFDVLSEVEQFTGLRFEVVNDIDADFPALLEMLYDGRAHIISDLLYSKEREGRYIWPANTITSDQCALLSKAAYPNVSVNEIASERVGLIKGTVHAGLFRAWFPNAVNVTEYDTADAAVHALDNGEVDLVMASKSYLLSFLNYFELSDYKANYLFSYGYQSTFGFNKDQAVLCSIVDKALSFIETDMIAEQWMTKTYDYHTKMIEAQRPWLIGAVTLSLIVLTLILVLFYRNRGEGKRLEKIVKKQTKELQYQTVVHNAMLDAIPDLIFTKDTGLRYTSCNKSMVGHLGITREELIGKSNITQYGLTVESSNRYNASLQQVMDTGERRDMEWSIPRFDGVETLFEAYHVPIVVDGAIIGVLGIARDMTQRKAMEEAVKNASEAKSQFIANMSHEMRTPMNVVVGLTDLMLEEDQPAKTWENLRKINSAGNTLMGLINDVLDISKIEAGKLELMPVTYELPSNVADIITLSKLRLEDKPVTFVLDIDRSMPISLYGDDLRVKQILNNLLSNAFKYTHKGAVTLRCRYTRDGDYVWMDFAVSDTGIGIREEDMAKLFTEYNQVDTRANRRIEGTGLGLSITKRLIDLMDGEITVESEYGKGTTFRVRIRQGFVSDETLSEETLESLRSFRYTDTKKQKKLVRSDLSYAKVLLVDDFPTNLDVAAGMLRKYKMQVDCIDNGQGAVDRIASGEPAYDAVFMDHMMPGMDGVEATALIRAIGTKYAQTIPIIALTANAVAGNEQMFLDSGFNAYLAKPINVMVLDSVVQRWVRDKSRE